MSVDFRIIAPSEASGVLADPAYHQATTVLCSLRDLLDWFGARGAVVHKYPSHYSVGTASGDGAEVHIKGGAGSGDVTQVTFCVYGENFDTPLIADCAARFGGIVFDHQSSEMLAPDEFLRRCRRDGT
jgi:hypothetical protein